MKQLNLLRNLPQKNVKLPENDIHKAVRKEHIKS